jgi:enoyl-CoA hydratase/carnithine racemase
MSKMTTLERHGQIGILTMKRGVTNALNLDLVEELQLAINDVKEDETLRGLLLQSSNDKFFCIGFDIPQLIPLPRDDFAHFYRSVSSMYLDLFALAKPTIAAITGHATAGGCILALACDYRYIAEGRKLMGLNEIKLGLPVPFIADLILRDLVGLHYSQEIVGIGEFYTPDQTSEMGMVDEVLPVEQVRSAAREKIKTIIEMPGPAYSMIKSNRIERIFEEIKSHYQAKESAFIDRWYAEDTRRLLQAAVAKF